MQRHRTLSLHDMEKGFPCQESPAAHLSVHDPEQRVPLSQVDSRYDELLDAFHSLVQDLDPCQRTSSPLKIRVISCFPAKSWTSHQSYSSVIWSCPLPHSMKPTAIFFSMPIHDANSC